MGQIKIDLRRFFVSWCSQAAILNSKYQFLLDSSRVHPSLIMPSQSPQSWTQMKVKGLIFLNEFQSVHQIDSFSHNPFFCYIV